jgi:RNA exonuclease 1
MKMIDKLAELKIPVAESYKRALQYEFELADQYHKNSKAVYLSKASSAIKNITTANFTIGGGADAEKNMLRDKFAHLVQGVEFYNRLLGYTLSNDQLKENGFPLLDMMSGAITINTEHKTKPHKPSSLHLRDKDYAFICRRCGKEFILHKENLEPDSDLPQDSWNECHYHPGKCWATGAKPKFSCCGGNPGSDACVIGDRHVHEYNRYTDLEGYEMTTDSFNEQLKVFALDCEMCYTRHGMELTRITVVDDNEKVVYDTFVEPQGDIIDYNTQFSGVTPEAIAQTNVNIEDVQSDLGKLFTVDSIILGHGLDGDFIALKLVHCKVVDTSVVFPHKKGLPYKRKLKTLMFDHLKKVIQEGGTVDVGHDSSEDAIACLLLMKWKIKEDAKAGNTI